MNSLDKADISCLRRQQERRKRRSNKGKRRKRRDFSTGTFALNHTHYNLNKRERESVLERTLASMALTIGVSYIGS